MAEKKSRIALLENRAIRIAPGMPFFLNRCRIASAFLCATNQSTKEMKWGKDPREDADTYFNQTQWLLEAASRVAILLRANHPLGSEPNFGGICRRFTMDSE